MLQRSVQNWGAAATPLPPVPAPLYRVIILNTKCHILHEMKQKPSISLFTLWNKSAIWAKVDVHHQLRMRFGPLGSANLKDNYPNINAIDITILNRRRFLIHAMQRSITNPNPPVPKLLIQRLRKHDPIIDSQHNVPLTAPSSKYGIRPINGHKWWRGAFERRLSQYTKCGMCAIAVIRQ